MAKEVGYIRKPHAIAACRPGISEYYYVGMSSLGFQTVYQLFNNHDDVVCERIFLPPKQQLKDQLASKAPLVTIESQSLARDFDVIAFSISFEWDYTNILTMLRLAGVPLRAADRTRTIPVVIGAPSHFQSRATEPFADVIARRGEELVPARRPLVKIPAAAQSCDRFRQARFYSPSFQSTHADELSRWRAKEGHRFTACCRKARSRPLRVRSAVHADIYRERSSGRGFGGGVRGARTSPFCLVGYNICRCGVSGIAFSPRT